MGVHVGLCLLFIAEPAAPLAPLTGGFHGLGGQFFYCFRGMLPKSRELAVSFQPHNCAGSQCETDCF